MTEKSITEGWRPDIKSWSKLDLETAKFYVSQSEARLKETTETYNLTTSRADNYLLVIIALLTGSVGYLFTGENIYLKSASFFVLIPIAFSIYFLIKNFHEYTVYTIGEEPKAIFTSDLVDSYEGDKQFKNLIVYTMITIQYKIDQNHSVNKKRIRNNVMARTSILFSPIAFLLSIIYQYYLGYQLVWSLSY